MAPADAGLPGLEGSVEAVWLRPPPTKTWIEWLTGKSAKQEKAIFQRERASGLVRVSEGGLDGSLEFSRMAKLAPGDYKKRAVLVQSLAHNEAIAKAFPDCKSICQESSAAAFAENITVNAALNCDTVCVGDIFEVVPSGGAAREGALRLQVSSPRRPCFKNDRMHASGVRKFAAEQGYAGFFFRPLSAGAISSGDKLTLVDRPRPTWTLRRVSQAVYGHGLAKDAGYHVEGYKKRLGGAVPAEVAEELEALLDFEELPEEEWKDEIRGTLGRAPRTSSPVAPPSTVSDGRGAIIFAGAMAAMLLALIVSVRPLK